MKTKNLLAVMLVIVMASCLFACGSDDNSSESESATSAATATATAAADEDYDAMTYEEYTAADLDTEVTVACYVQATQSWWNDVITVYAADEDGAYFIYEMACSEEDAEKLVAGTRILVTGYKSEWSGEIEITDATFKFIDGDSYYVGATDVTELLGTDELINYQNQLVSFTGMTVEAIEYKNGEPGDDIYVTLSLNGESYDFCVEVYLTGTDTEVYTTVGELAIGDVVNVEGYLYWYNGMNPHITSIAIAE
ncbi:MAG: hypothetical protein IJZ90_04490 [Clostridia bacterium]|nr:hypothetical protein [Clostridia bacterium]